jgi:hypothetical protein
MTRLTAALALTCAVGFCQSRNGRHEDWRNWDYKDSQTIEKSFDVSKGSDAKKLLVDEMNGYIHVTGGSGSQIKVTLHKETRGRSQAAVDEGKRLVDLEMTQQSNYVRLSETAPWRGSNGNNNYRGDDWYGYHVALNVDVEVPAGTQLDLHSFNDGVEVKGTSGDYNVHAFNGPIIMDDVSGSGEVQSFNGAVTVSYRQNPQKDTRYKTFNGELNIKFQQDFNADLHFKTFHGDIFSDFDVQPLPTTVSGKLTGGRYLLRSNGGSGRVGKGGPTLSFDAFNGRISLRTK